jgi:hypothetical protein
MLPPAADPPREPRRFTENVPAAIRRFLRVTIAEDTDILSGAQLDRNKRLSPWFPRAGNAEVRAR